jgi:kumamolisin
MRGISMPAGAIAMIAALAGPTLPSAAQAQNHAVRGGQVITPDSGVEAPADIGVRAHTNFLLFEPTGGMQGLTPRAAAAAVRRAAQGAAPDANVPDQFQFWVETPASLNCVYNLAVPAPAGCNPYDPTVVHGAGGSRAVAVAVAYDDPTAVADMAVFSNEFSLRAANLTVVYASGTQPAFDSNWMIEATLDIQWVHAIAPAAPIYLVEAATNSDADLLTAVSVASNLVKAAGGGEVSMSWGSSEFAGETDYDSYFTTPGVVYVAGSGDSAGTLWPSVSPNVVAVGGTTISRNWWTGNFQREVAWQSGGGGLSAYEPRPSYQNGISAIVGSQRGTPDVAALADVGTGVYIYFNGIWAIAGGTSLSGPIWAGLINDTGNFYSSSAAELAQIYSGGTGYNAIADGVCGPNRSYLATGSWSFCTGHGAPNGKANK